MLQGLADDGLHAPIKLGFAESFRTLPLMHPHPPGCRHPSACREPQPEQRSCMSRVDSSSSPKPSRAAQTFMTLPLTQRHARLEAAIEPLPDGLSLNGSKLRGRIVVMTPGMRMPTGRKGCTLCSTEAECEALAQEACDYQVRTLLSC